MCFCQHYHNAEFLNDDALKLVTTAFLSVGPGNSVAKGEQL